MPSKLESESVFTQMSKLQALGVSIHGNQINIKHTY